MRRVPRWPVTTALLAVSLAAPVAGQDVAGGLEGWAVETAAGEPLPDVEVTAEGPRLQAPRATRSDDRGRFLLLALPAGMYTVRLRLIGRRPVTLRQVTVLLGQASNLGEIPMEPEALELPEITVSGQRPVVDPSSTALATNLRYEDFSDLPVQRNFRSIIALAPQANASYLGDEANIAGSSGGENAYFVDGVNVTDPHFGATSFNLPYNFVEEIQIKTGGYEAEYGRALGGIVNVVTPSGGNTFKGQGYAFLTQDELRADARLGTDDVALGSFSQYDIGGSLGGPIVRDRLWFFAAYNPTFDRRDASVPGSGPLRDERTSHLLAGKLTWQATPVSSVTFTALGDPSRHDRVAFYDDGSGPVTNPEAILGRLSTGGSAFSLRGQTIARPNLLLEAFVSYSAQVLHNEPATELGREEPRIDDLVTGITSGGYGASNRIRLRRTAASLSATLGLGAHSVKLGAAYEDNFADETFDVGLGELGGFIIRTSESSYTWQKALTVGRAHNRIPTLYLQDGWQANRRLRLNAGLRYEAQYLTGSDGKVAQSITGELQPRIGAIYLPGRLGSQRVFASWGRYYEQVPLVLATTSYGEGNLLLIDYPQNPLVSEAGADTLQIALGGSPRVEDLRGQSYDEATLGYERSLGTDFKVGARGIYRRLRWAIEDGYDAAGDRFAIGNPGLGSLGDFPRARRTYTGLELTVERLGQADFTFLASYVLSRSHGNYTGLFASDVPDGGANISAQFDFPEQLLNGRGLLPNDHPHVLKFHGAYRLHFGLTVGTSFLWQSGAPLNEYGATSVGAPYWSFVRQRGTAGRAPSVWDLNLRFTYALPLPAGSRAKPQLVLDVFHVGSPRRAVLIDQTRFTALDDAGNQIAPSPTYGAVARYQEPMSARLGVVIGLE